MGLFENYFKISKDRTDNTRQTKQDTQFIMKPKLNSIFHLHPQISNFLNLTTASLYSSWSLTGIVGQICSYLSEKVSLPEEN